MQLNPLSLDLFPEPLRRHADPAAPPPLRMMAARGLVPAAPRETAMLLYQLARDADAAIAAAARDTLGGLPTDLVRAAAAAPLDPRVLDHIAQSRKGDEAILESVLVNMATADETVEALAGKCSEHLSEIIAVNEVRLLRSPKIIERLYLNENARMSTLDRLIDLAKRNGVKFELLALQNILDDPGYNTAKVAADSKARAETGNADHAFRELLKEAVANEQDQDSHLTEEEEEAALPEVDLEAEPGEEEEERSSSNIATRILSMTISEKTRMAILGSGAEREFLIKDNNRLVYMAAVTSPKVRLKDIQAWSGNRIVPDGVLSYIASHRRYRRVYQVITNLVNNPKTPVKDALRLLPSVAPKDLKTIEKNRNVPHPVRRQAKVILEAREKKDRR